jgi:flagellar biogenesis protein FliO
MNLKDIFSAAQDIVSSPPVAATNAAAVMGISAGKMAQGLSDWLQVVILFGTALTILVKLGWELRKMIKKSRKKSRCKKQPSSHSPS